MSLVNCNSILSFVYTRLIDNICVSEFRHNPSGCMIGSHRPIVRWLNSEKKVYNCEFYITLFLHYIAKNVLICGNLNFQLQGLRP
jgi:hypothetical protein